MNISDVKNIYSSEPYLDRNVAREDLLELSGIVVVGELLCISLPVPLPSSVMMFCSVDDRCVTYNEDRL